MRNLEELRVEIDEIDRQLVELFEKRMDVVKEVARYKEKNHLPILDSEREKSVIAKNVSRLKNRGLQHEAEEFFQHLMDVSRKYQAKELHGIGVSLPVMDKAYKKPGPSKKLCIGFQGGGGIMGNMYGLIGEKLGHSFSPLIHSMIMEKLNIKGYYHLLEIKREHLIQACLGLKYMSIKGVNVTIPYKVEVMKALDEISDEAMNIGAVNTICFENGMAKGFNTDYYGFGMLLDKSGISIPGESAVILGTGGAANSVIQYLLDNGIGDIVLASRNIVSAKEKFKGFNVCGYDEIQKLKGFSIIINCTPCGMYPNINECAVAPEALNSFSYAVDLIYNPSETLFLKYARERGLTAVNGLYMLVGQAVKAQELWNGISIPSDMADEIYIGLSGQIDSGC